MRKIALVGIAVLALAGCSSSSGDTVTESTSPSPVMTASPAGAIEVADAYIMTNGDVAGMFA